MRLLIPDAIRVDHDELTTLVLEGFHGVGKRGVELHLSAHRGRVIFHGRAWPEIPPGAAVAPETRYLVQISMPKAPSQNGFPFEWRYPRRKTAPWLVAHTWQERLLAVAAHEAYHVKQFRFGMRRSEVTAERWAAKALERFRSRGLIQMDR